LFPRKTGTVRRPTPACQPRVEALEERLAPTVNPVHLYDLNGTLADRLGGPALVADGGTLSARTTSASIRPPSRPGGARGRSSA
jgi:hypothetical protein